MKKFRRYISLALTISLLFTEMAFADAAKPDFSDFPESYRPYLSALKEKYPNWNFVPDVLNIDFEEAVDNEAVSSLSLVENNSPASWKSSKEEDFDFDKNTWKVYDGDSWVAASREVVAYYMDPRNFLPVSDTAETKSSFQFLDFSYDSTKQTKTGLEKMIKGTFLEKTVISAETAGTELLSLPFAETPSDAAGHAAITDAEKEETPSDAKRTKESFDAEESFFSGSSDDELFERLLNAAFEAEAFTAELMRQDRETEEETEEELSFLSSSGDGTYADIIMEAAEISGISPYVLAAFILQEQGTAGTSELISGSQPGFPGIYNYFNVGAYAAGGFTSIERGLWWAGGQDNNSTSYGRPWNTPQKAIINGAVYLSDGYLKKGQNTIYYKRFNVGPDRKTTLYLHQYMTNVQGAWAEGWLLGKSCEDNGVLKDEYTFHIPVYDNMPEKAAAKPEGDLNPNSRLRSLSVKGYELTPAFKGNIYEYTVDAGTAAEVTVNAEAIAKTSKVKGTGTVKLSGKETKIFVAVTAENGAEKVYTVTVRNSGPSGNGNAGDSNNGTSGSSSGGGGSSGSGSSSKGSSGSSGGSGSKSSGGSSGGGGGAVPSVKKTGAVSGGATFSSFWFSDPEGIWRIRRGEELIKSAWLCDDAVTQNGKNVWYLLNQDGTMLAAGLVRDNTGNFYSLETNHNGYYGMLRYQDGTYDCNGIRVYIEFSRNHDGTFGAVKNSEAIEKLKAIYGITDYRIGNESCVYTGSF